MTIDEHIGVIEDLKSTMSVCMPEPEKTEICTSLSEAIDTMRKYQKIQEIMNELNGDFYGSYLKDRQALEKIYEEVENGNDD